MRGRLCDWGSEFGVKQALLFQHLEGFRRQWLRLSLGNGRRLARSGGEVQRQDDNPRGRQPGPGGALRAGEG